MRTKNIFEEQSLLSGTTDWSQIEGKAAYGQVSIRLNADTTVLSWFAELASRVTNEINCDSFIDTIGLWIKDAATLEANTLGAFHCLQTNTFILANTKRSASSDELYLNSHAAPDKRQLSFQSRASPRR
jgi:hypothetical protein